MLTCFDPFRDFDRVSRDLTGRGRRSWMSMDAYRRDGQVVVSFDLPGIDPESLDVTVEKDALTVRADRNFQVAEGERVLVSERPTGRFTRRLLLGEHLDGDRIEARYDNGVLTLTIPVAEQAQARKVQIASGAPQAVEGEQAAA
jgi:HSP20 family protein